MRLRHRIIVILSMTLLPMIAIQIYTVATLRAERIAELGGKALREAELVHAVVTHALAGDAGLAWRAGKLVEGGGTEDCAAGLQAIRLSTPHYAALRIYGPEGALRCESGEGPGASQSAALAAEAAAASAMRLGVYAATDEGGILPIAFPIIAEGVAQARGSLVGDLRLGRLGDMIAQLDQPPGRTVVLGDREGNMIARWPDHARYVGSEFLPTVAPLVAETAPGNALIPSFDGKDRLIGYIPPALPPHGLWTSVGYVHSDQTQQIDHAARLSYLFMAAITLGAGLLALATARIAIERPAEELISVARRLREGDLSARPAMGQGAEFGEIADALSRMAQTLEERERRDVVLREEANHRVRNTISTAIGMVNGGARSATSIQAYRDALIDRLHALARVQTMGATADEAVDVRALLVAELDPHGGMARVTMNGPPLAIEGDVAQALALATHELVTNAAKYGALSTAGGRIAVSWSVEPGPPRRLILEWRETGGPLVTPPTREGFGDQLLRAVVERRLRGRLDRDFAPEGLRARVDVPISAAA